MELTDNLKKCMSPGDRKQFGRAGLTNEEHEANACVKLEKELHNQYIGFLDRNELEYIHAPMHRRSTLPVGWPDFTVFGPGGKTFCVEFKVGRNTIDKDQRDRKEALQRLGFPVIVPYTFSSAMIATKEFFNL